MSFFCSELSDKSIEPKHIRSKPNYLPNFLSIGTSRGLCYLMDLSALIQAIQRVLTVVLMKKHRVLADSFRVTPSNNFLRCHTDQIVN